MHNYKKLFGCLVFLFTEMYVSSGFAIGFHMPNGMRPNISVSQKPPMHNWYQNPVDVVTNNLQLTAMLPSISFAIVDVASGELTKRFIHMRNGFVEKDHSLWIHGYGKKLNLDNSVKASMMMGGADFGYDVLMYADANNIFVMGPVAGYTYTGDIETRNRIDANANATIKTSNVGLYGAWVSNSGWFANISGRMFFTSMGATLDDSSSFNHNGKYMASILELGHEWSHELDTFSQLTFDVIGSFHHLYGFKSSFGTDDYGDFEYHDVHGIKGGLYGVMAHEIANANLDFISRPFFRAGLLLEMDGVMRMRSATESYENNFGGIMGEIAIGYELKKDWNKHMFFNLSYSLGRVIKDTSVNMGLRYNF